MTDGQSSGSSSPGIVSVSSGDQGNADQKMDLGIKTGEAVLKLSEAVQQVGSQARETATSLASEAGEKAKGFLHHQVDAGADFVDDIAQSVRVAAESLDQNAPQLAGLVRGVAQQVQEFSQSVRGQTVEELFATTSDFVRRNPTMVFSAAAACGFMLFRVIRAGPSHDPRSGMRQGNLGTNGLGQQAGGLGGSGFQGQHSGGQGQARPFHGS